MNSALRMVPTVSAALFTLGLASLPGFAQSANSHVAPAILEKGKNMGKESASTPLTLTAYLNLHNRAELDARVQALYTPGSPTYHQWLTAAELKAYAPTAADMAAVKAELRNNNLAVVSSDALGLSVRFTGKSSDVEKAFGTQITRYEVNGKLTRAASLTPHLSGQAAGLLHHLSGLNTLPPRSNVVAPYSPGGKKQQGIPVSKAKTSGLAFSSLCLNPPTSAQEFGVSAQTPTTPVLGTFAGLTYGTLSPAQPAGSSPSCGYGPSDVQSFYGLDEAFKLGYTGTGETIVIVDAYAQPTALADLTTFSSLYGLPAPTSSTFKIYDPFAANQPGSDYGTDVETDIDVEYAHATAPGAKIALVQAFSEDEEDMQAALLYAVNNKLGNVLSLSYGYQEFYSGEFALDIWSEIVEMGAAQGIAFNVSSGDDGDLSDYEGPGNTDVDAPADSPYATAVGGTSVVETPKGGPVYTTGWGTNIGYLSYSSDGADYLYDPPESQFYAGSGGGVSAYFAKPSYQSALPGSKRLIPDVSALADPFTGAEIVYTDSTDGNQYIAVYGGTSLAAPIFSGIWTVADEYFGKPLGQAAPYVAATVGSFITDVLPLNGPANATATLTDPSGTKKYTAADLLGDLFTTTQFTSALWNYAPGSFDVVGFGTDSSLTVTQGWDDVTGYGTPNIGTALLELGAKPKS